MPVSACIPSGEGVQPRSELHVIKRNRKKVHRRAGTNKENSAPLAAKEKRGSSSRHTPHRNLPAEVVARRNQRERTRVTTVNGEFSRLQRLLPSVRDHKRRVPKERLLRLAARYIRHLQLVLKSTSGQGEIYADSFSTAASVLRGNFADSMVHPSPYRYYTSDQSCDFSSSCRNYADSSLSSSSSSSSSPSSSVSGGESYSGSWSPSHIPDEAISGALNTATHGTLPGVSAGYELDTVSYHSPSEKSYVHIAPPAILQHQAEPVSPSFNTVLGRAGTRIVQELVSTQQQQQRREEDQEALETPHPGFPSPPCHQYSHNQHHNYTVSLTSCPGTSGPFPTVPSLPGFLLQSAPQTDERSSAVHGSAVLHMPALRDAIHGSDSSSGGNAFSFL